MINFTPAPTVLETVAWLAYGIPVLVIFLWPQRPKQPQRPEPPRQPAPTPEPVESN